MRKPLLSRLGPRQSSDSLTLVQLSYLDWLESEDNARASTYTMLRDYYDGDHETQLTQRMRRFLELKQGQDFCINVCPIVVDALAERLKVAGFDCSADPEQIKDWWNANRMDAVQVVTHLSAVRDGDTYVLVEWDNEQARPRFTHENGYDGSDGVHVIYSDERRDEPIVAIKRWTATSGSAAKTRRANLYFPDRIEKFWDAGQGTWARYFEDEQEAWPIPWTDKSGRPLGIPVIHFKNKNQGYSYGESEQDDVIPLQNASNKALIDLLAAADATGFRLYTMTGGDPSGVTVAPGSWVWHEDPNVKIGVIDGADLDRLLRMKDSLIADIARITRTPLSYFQLTGQVASSNTLKEQREGLNSKAADRQVTFGNAWEDVMRMARRLHNTFGPGGADDVADISTIWTPLEEQTPQERASEVEALDRAGAISLRTKVRKLHPDWDEQQIEEEVQAIRDEQGMTVPDFGGH